MNLNPLFIYPIMKKSMFFSQRIFSGVYAFNLRSLFFSVSFLLVFISNFSFGQTYSFTGAQQTFTASVAGCYTIKAWGAKGGNDAASVGGNGGFAQGELYLNAGQVVYIYVGGAGVNSLNAAAGGWNGGGNAGNAGSSGGGGGATDIRIGGTALSNRVLVAGGGGGAGNSLPNVGGPGGGLIGGVPSGGGTASNGGGGGTQTAGGAGANAGSVGQGGHRASGGDGGGGGGGYFGGGAGNGDYGGGGGSSYIGGVINGSTIAGNVSMPNPTGGANVVGNAGSGAVTIALSVYPTASLTTVSKTICRGNAVALGGNVTIGAGVAWTLTLSNGQTTSGTGPGAWSITVNPTATTVYTIASLSIPNCYYLSGSTTITLPTVSGNLATNGQGVTCVVNAFETVHFYEATSGNYISSITAGAVSLGNTNATVYVDATNQLVPACTNPSYQTAVMQRHWVISPSINGSATVTLPYLNTELTNVATASNTSSSPDDLVINQSSVLLSKYSAGAPGSTTAITYVNANPNDNCTVGNTTLHTNVANGSVPVPGVNSLYSRFSIPGFSEFWLHGMTQASPLPVTLSSFSALCDGESKTQLNWETASEFNSSYFTVERSRNGMDWNNIAIVNGAGTSSEKHVYEVAYNGTEGVYYRLSQTDFDGKTTVLEVIHMDCDNTNDELTVFPNPNAGTFTVKIESSQKVEQAKISLVDLNGSVVSTLEMNLNIGTNLFHFDENTIQSGVYFIVFDSQAQHPFHPVRMIKH